MALDILCSSGSQIIDVARCFGPTFISEDFPLPTAAGVAYHGDIFGRMVSNYQFALRLPSMSVRKAFWMVGASQDMDILPVSYPVEQTSLIGDYDERAYGNVYHNAYRVLLERIGNIRAPSLEHEHYARHFTFSGQLMPASAVVPWIDDDLVTHRYTITGVPRLSKFYRRANVSNLDPLVLEYIENPDYPAPPTFDLLAVLSRLQAGTVDYHQYTGVDRDAWVYGSDWRTSVSHVKYHFNDDLSFEVQYHSDVSTSQGVTYSWDSSVKFRTDFTFVPTIPQPTLGLHSGMLWLTTGAPLDFNISGYTASANTFRSGAPGACSVPNLYRAYRDYAVTLPQVGEVSKYNMGWAEGVARSDLLETLRLSFRKTVNENWKDILPSATFSTVDALGKMEGSVNNNVLQTLYKIPEIASALPDIVAAVDILSDLAKRDLSASTIRDILDLLTSTHLQAEFQWRPYYLLLTKYLPKIVSLLSQLGQPKQLVTGYGSFSFEISNDLGREKVHLMTRSKVMVDITLSGALSAALSLDAAGLLPRFSRAWDLIPFTFMVNWVTGVGRMVADMETLGFAALVPASYVHSYTLTSPFQKGELDALGASSSGEPPAGLKVFIRDKTLYPPIPRLSRFPFGVPSRYPSAGLLGSLFYQLFVS